MPIVFILCGLFLILFFCNVLNFKSFKVELFLSMISFFIIVGYLTKDIIFANYSFNVFHFIVLIILVFICFHLLDLKLLCFIFFFSLICYIVLDVLDGKLILLYGEKLSLILCLFALVFCGFNFKGFVFIVYGFLFVNLINLYFEYGIVDFHNVSFEILFDVLLLYALLSLIFNCLIFIHRRYYCYEISKPCYNNFIFV